MIGADRDFATMQEFIGGRLPEDERRAFEDRLRRDPELVRELELSLRLCEGLRQVRTKGYFRKAASRVARSRIWVPSMLAAAGAGLALFLWLSRVTPPSSILVPGPQTLTATASGRLVAAHFTFVTARGISVPDLDLPLGGVIEIRAAPSTRQTVHRYRVTLIRKEDGHLAKPIAGLGDLALSTDGYVHCYADASRLPYGRYELRMQPDRNAQGTADVFEFNLRATSTATSR